MNGPRPSNEIPPESRETREPRVFEGYHRLSRLSLPAGYTHVGPEAFAGCFSLRSITLPGQVSSLEEDLFEGCTNLREVTICSRDVSLSRCRRIFDGCGKVLLRVPAGSATQRHAEWWELPFETF